MQPFTTTREQQIKAYHKIYAQLKRAGFIASTVMAWEDSHSSILRLGANNAQIPKKEDREAREMFLAQVFAFLESKGYQVTFEPFRQISDYSFMNARLTIYFEF